MYCRGNLLNAKAETEKDKMNKMMIEQSCEIVDTIFCNSINLCLYQSILMLSFIVSYILTTHNVCLLQAINEHL